MEGKAKCSIATRKVKMQPKPKPKVASTNWSSYPSNYSYTTYPTLASNNLKVGEIIEFYSHGLPDVSESTKKGTLYGCITEGKKLSVKSYNQPNSSLAGYYTGLVTSMIKDNGLDTVVVRDPWLIEVVQGDTNNKGKEALINAALDTHLVIQTEQTHV